MQKHHSNLLSICILSLAGSAWALDPAALPHDLAGKVMQKGVSLQKGESLSKPDGEKATAPSGVTGKKGNPASKRPTAKPSSPKAPGKEGKTTRNLPAAQAGRHKLPRPITGQALKLPAAALSKTPPEPRTNRPKTADKGKNPTLKLPAGTLGKAVPSTKTNRLKAPGKGSAPALKLPASALGRTTPGSARTIKGDDKPRSGGLPLPTGRGIESQQLRADKVGRPEAGKIQLGRSVGLPAAGAATQPTSGDGPYATNAVTIRSARFDNRHVADDGWPEWDLAVELENTDRTKPAIVSLSYNRYPGAIPVKRDPIYHSPEELTGVSAWQTIQLDPGETRVIRLTDGGYTFTTCGRLRLEGPSASGGNTEQRVCLGDPASWQVTAEITVLKSQFDGDRESPTRWHVCWKINEHQDCFTGFASDHSSVAEAQGRRLSFIVNNLRQTQLEAQIRIVDKDPGLFDGDDDIGEGRMIVKNSLRTVASPRVADAYLMRLLMQKHVLPFQKIGATGDDEGPKGVLEFTMTYLPR